MVDILNVKLSWVGWLMSILYYAGEQCNSGLGLKVPIIWAQSKMKGKGMKRGTYQ